LLLFYQKNVLNPSLSKSVNEVAERYGFGLVKSLFLNA